MVSQRGHVLWMMLVLLGLLAELATASLQQAASSGLMALADERRQRREARAESVALALEALPVPASRDASAGLLWGAQQAVDDVARQGCGRAAPGSYLTPCDLPVSGDLLTAGMWPPGWHWQLLRLPDDESEGEGTDLAAFPGLRSQDWLLQVVISSRDGQSAAWRYRYRQQAAP